MPPPLYVFTARFNPIGWRVPHQHYLDWAQYMRDLGADITVVECAYGEAQFECELPGVVTHIGVRADSWAWTKENLINIGISRRPEAKYICWADSDVFPRRKDWVQVTLDALQHYHIVQPWETCYDLGPGESHIDTWRSFCSNYVHGHPLVVPDGETYASFWAKHPFPHPGYCWAAKRRVLDHVGGLFELGGMGSGDNHMAVGLLGLVNKSVHKDIGGGYRRVIEAWEARAQAAVNGRIGYIPGTIEHRFHGKKRNRLYWERWQMFLRHGFDPTIDLKRNTWGVVEFAGNKPALEHEWDQYLRMRWEDDNGEGFAPFHRSPEHDLPQPPRHHPPHHPPAPPRQHPWRPGPPYAS